MDNQWEIAYVQSIGHLIDDVTRPWKVIDVTPKCLGPIISKTAGDTASDGYNGHMTDDVGELLIVSSVCLGAREALSKKVTAYECYLVL